MSKVIWTVICIVILCGSTLANDVKINGEASVQPLDETTAQISFKVSWEHSWREGENWDAIWVFVKYKRRGVNEPWHHAYLKDSDNNRVASAAGVPAMQVLAVTSTENWAQRMDTLYFGNDIPNTVRGLDRKVVPGVLIFRKKPGTGNIVNAPVRLEWDFNEGDLNLYSEITRQDIRDGKIEISVQAIEMVYVPVGPYYLGDRLSAYSFINEGANGALRISSDDEQMLYRMGITAGSTYDKAWKVPDLFPMGYTGFYAMKYEVSQEQYVNFLNRLTLRDQRKRIGRSLESLNPGDYVFGATKNQEEPSYRNGIVLLEKYLPLDTPALFGFNLSPATPSNYPDDGKSVACNFMSPEDMYTYLDWAGLRPMTEAEYEKGCRDRDPAAFAVDRSFAWETPNYTSLSWNTIQHPGEENEKVSGGANLNGPVNAADMFPVKCGAFADDVPDMEGSGASRWGLMEMTGNLGEIYYNAEHATAFNGDIYGDGNIWSTPTVWNDSLIGLDTVIWVPAGWNTMHIRWCIPYEDVYSKYGNPMFAMVCHSVVLNGGLWGGYHSVHVDYSIPFPTISWPDSCQDFGLRGGSFESTHANEMSVSYRGDADYYKDKSVDARLLFAGFRGGRAVPVRELQTGVIAGQNKLKRDTAVMCAANPYTIIETAVGQDDEDSALYAWEINDGNGWRELSGKTGRELVIDWPLNDSVPWHEYVFRRHSVAAHAEGYSNEVTLCVPGVIVYDNKKTIEMGQYDELVNLNVELGTVASVKVEWLDDYTSKPGVWYSLYDDPGVTDTKYYELHRNMFNSAVAYGDNGVITIRTTVTIGSCSFPIERELSMQRYAYVTIANPINDGRDGKVYQTNALADSRVWMAEDLRYQVAAGASWGAGGADGNYTKAQIQAAYAGKIQLCPDGWELPTAGDWENLMYFYGDGLTIPSTTFPCYSTGYLYDPACSNLVNGLYKVTTGASGLSTPYDVFWTKDYNTSYTFNVFPGWGTFFGKNSVSGETLTTTHKVRCVKKK